MSVCVLEKDMTQILRRIECIDDRTKMETRKDIAAELRTVEIDIINEVKRRVNKVLSGSEYAMAIVRIFEERVAELTDKVEKMEKDLEDLRTDPEYLKSKAVDGFRTYAFRILSDSVIRDLISRGASSKEIMEELIESVSLVTTNPIAFKILGLSTFYQSLLIARRRYSKTVMADLFEEFIREYVDLLIPFIFGKSYEYWSNVMYNTDMRVRNIEYDLMTTKNAIETYRALIMGIKEGYIIENSWKLADINRKYVITLKYSIDSIISREMRRIQSAVMVGKDGEKIAEMFREFLEICGIPLPE